MFSKGFTYHHPYWQRATHAPIQTLQALALTRKEKILEISLIMNTLVQDGKVHLNALWPVKF